MIFLKSQPFREKRKGVAPSVLSPIIPPPSPLEKGVASRATSHKGGKILYRPIWVDGYVGLVFPLRHQEIHRFPPCLCPWDRGDFPRCRVLEYFPPGASALNILQPGRHRYGRCQRESYTSKYFFLTSSFSFSPSMLP